MICKNIRYLQLLEWFNINGVNDIISMRKVGCGGAFFDDFCGKKSVSNNDIKSANYKKNADQNIDQGLENVNNKNLENEKSKQNKNSQNLENSKNPSNNSLQNKIILLEILKNKIKNFDHQLKYTAKNFVFNDGNPCASIAVVGEAPGDEEDAQGIPFVGQSGALLNNILKAINLERSDVYILNIIPYKPMGNRTPNSKEMQEFRPFVIEHLKIIQPKIIVCLGSVASKCLINSIEPISQLRGKWSVIDEVDAKIMATFHPAFLLRSPSQKKEVWGDFLQVMNALKNLN